MPRDLIPLIARPVFRALASLVRLEERALASVAVVNPFPNLVAVVVVVDVVVSHDFVPPSISIKIIHPIYTKRKRIS